MLQNKKMIFLGSLVMTLASGSALSNDNSILKSIDKFENERITNAQNLILLEQRLEIGKLNSQLEEFGGREGETGLHGNSYDAQEHNLIINQPAAMREDMPEEVRQALERAERAERAEREAENRRQQEMLEEKNRTEGLKRQKRQELSSFNLRGVYKTELVSIARVGQGSRTLEVKVGDSLPGGWIIKKISESYLEVSNRMLPGEKLTISGG